VALDCGYSAASIRERIYSADGSAGEEPMAVSCLYTAAPDAEGTLGGLVSLAEPNVSAAFSTRRCAARRCAVPIQCARTTFRANTIPAATGPLAHACLFLPETSCECGNRYLDRSVLEATLAETGIAYFDVL